MARHGQQQFSGNPSSAIGQRFAGAHARHDDAELNEEERDTETTATTWDDAELRKEDSETVLSASRAAAKGGFTALSAMPNTSPVADTAGVVEQVLRLGVEAGLCDVFPIGAVTKNLQGSELSEIGAMADSAAAVRIFSDDGHCVSNPAVMRRALEYVKKFDGVIAQHAQDPDLTVNAQMNEGVVSSVLGLKGWPAVAEEAIIARDVLLTEHVQSRLHVCHVTTAGGVEIIRWAKAR